MQQIKTNKFNDFSLGNAGTSFTMITLISVLGGFLISIVGSIFLTIMLGNQENVSAALQKFSVNIILSALLQVAFFVSIVLFAKRVNVDWVKAIKLNVKPNLFDMLVAVAFSFGIVFALLPLSNLFMSFLEALGYKEMISLSITTPMEYILGIIFACAFPALVEEFMFRGVILSGLRKKGDIFAIFISALLFSLFHQNPSQTIHQFVVGVIWATIAIKTGSIWVTILLHFLNNFIAITVDFILHLSGTTDISPVANYILLGIGILVFILCCLYYGLKYFKKNKKEENCEIEYDENDTENENIEEVGSLQQEKSVSGRIYELKDGLVREKVSGKRFFMYLSLGLVLCCIMWTINLVIGMKVF